MMFNNDIIIQSFFISFYELSEEHFGGEETRARGGGGKGGTNRHLVTFYNKIWKNYKAALLTISKNILAYQP